MDINSPNIGKDPVVIAQLVVAPVGRAPLEGFDFLLDATGFQNLVEHLHLIKILKWRCTLVDPTL